MQLKDFCSAVGKLVADNPVEAVPGLIAKIMPAILSERDLLTPAQMAVPAKGYGRHDVFLCPNDNFSIIAAVWPAGIVSPIHDHKTWCTFGVFRGVIAETRYKPASDDPLCRDAVPVFRQEWAPGDVAHLPVGGGDIHCMHNPTDKATVSIHVYGGNSAKLGPNVVNVYRETSAAFA